MQSTAISEFRLNVKEKARVSHQGRVHVHCYDRGCTCSSSWALACTLHLVTHKMVDTQVMYCRCDPRKAVDSLCRCKPVPGVHYRMNLKDVPFLLTNVSYCQHTWLYIRVYACICPFNHTCTPSIFNVAEQWTGIPLQEDIVLSSCTYIYVYQL